MEKGTLYQIRNLIDRRNITKHPKSNVNAAEDFVEVIIISHVLTAVKKYLGMNSIHDLPSPSVISHDVWMADDTERSQILADISVHIVNKYVDLSTTFYSPQQGVENGTAYDYAREVMSLGLFYLNLKDTSREGDGDRNINWKYKMLLFKASGRTNYSIEALTILTQYYLLLPPNLAEQLKWSRFVNTRGLPGHNISCDLHNEHLNKAVKVAIEGLGANKSKKAITRVAKAIGVLTEVTDSFDEAVCVAVPSSKYSKKSMEKDIDVIVKQLMECDVFNPEKKSIHASFRYLKPNLIKTIDETTLKEWMAERLAQNLQPPSILMEESENEDDTNY